MSENKQKIKICNGEYWIASGKNWIRATKVKCERCGKERYDRKNRKNRPKYCKRCSGIESHKQYRVYETRSKEYHQLLERRKTAVMLKGNKCNRCGAENLPIYCYCFHHIDPETKKFNILGRIRNMEIWKEELKKTVLLCLHCHKIVHCGDLKLLNTGGYSAV